MAYDSAVDTYDSATTTYVVRPAFTIRLARVEIAFGVDPYDSATLDVTSNWVDVFTSCRSVTYRTSARSDRFSGFTAGAATVILDDRTRDFDPSYTSSPYVNDFRRSTPVRIVGHHSLGAATFDVTGGASEDLWTLTAHGLDVGGRVRFTAAGDGATPYTSNIDYYVVAATANTFQLSETLAGAVLEGADVDSSGTWTVTRLDTQFYGYAKLWTPSYKGKDAVTTLKAVDGVSLLSRYELDAIDAAYAGDTVAGRIGRILDETGFPSSYRDLDQGAALTSTTFDVNALNHCQLAAASDGGFFYAQRDGVLTFDGLVALTTTRQATSQATFSHTTKPAYLINSLDRTGVGEGFRNVVRVGGPAVTTAIVDPSTANQAPIVYQRLNLLMNADAKATGLANFYADLYSTETPFMSAVRFVAAAAADLTYNSGLFVRKIRDRVTVEFDPPGAGANLSDQCFIDGMSGVITPALWEIGFLLSSADAYDNNLSVLASAWMLLGTTTTSKLGVGKLGY